jgi:O-antigen biosynthesis protein
VTVLRGGEYDRWDLEVFGGLLGRVRLRMTQEEHGAGRQLTRIRLRPRLATAGAGVLVFLIALFGLTAALGDWAGAAAFGVIGLQIAIRMGRDWAAATGASLAAIGEQAAEADELLIGGAPHLWQPPRRRPGSRRPDLPKAGGTFVGTAVDADGI